MSAIKSHYSCAEEMNAVGVRELAAALNTTERTIQQWVKNGKLPKSTRHVSNGGRPAMRWEINSLPQDIKSLIKERALHALVKAVPVVPLPQPATAITVATPINSGELKDWQRQTADARAAICAEVRRLAAAGGIERAIRMVIDLAERGGLAPHLQRLVTVANAKAGTQRALSRGTLYRWLNESQGGWVRLAPKSREAAAIPAWAPYLLGLYQQPQKPGLAYCLERLPATLPPAITAPSYAAANRFLKKMSKTEIQRGRMGSREIKTILPFVRRDTSQMWPDAYTADGHTFDAEVAHPAHGKAFRPEITTVLDIATRKAVGWSAGLAESTWAVLDALRNACENCGIPSIFYADNGSGYKNEAMGDEATGFMERLGIELTHSLPYNSQARGIIERSHQTIWVRGAKTLPTYMGAPMDAEARQKVYKLTRADIKTSGTSRHLMGWQEFVGWCQQQVDAYNDRPHRGLPKVRGEDGKQRHQSPNEAWAQAIAEGWQPTPVKPQDADDLFRPYKTCKVNRGEIRLFGNLYFDKNLEHYHGETARVGYDIHDASRIWVRDQDGRLICVAGFEANKRSYFPESFSAQAAQKRATGRIKRAQVKIDEAEAELNPQQMIEYQPAAELAPLQIEHAGLLDITRSETMPETNIAPLPERAGVRPWFTSDMQKYRWLMKNKDAWARKDAADLLAYVRGWQYHDMLEPFAYEGLVWAGSDAEKAQEILRSEEELAER